MSTEAARYYTEVAAHAETRRQFIDAQLTVAEFKGTRLSPKNGCEFFDAIWGPLTVKLEVEVEPADGDGYYTPRYEQSFRVVGVLLNGRMCDPDEVASIEQVERWHEAFERHLKDQADEAGERAAEERAEEFA